MEQSGQHSLPEPNDHHAMSLEELLRERIKLDELLQQQFCRDVTLLFTDIKGSMAYFEQHGDLSGRQMVQRQNDLLFPIVEQFQGTILKTIGDAVMASFGEATAAVQSAIAMQRAFRDFNSRQDVAEQIHIRVGINSGQALVESHDVFGDVVNVASRVESCALPDQILISSATYDRLTDTIPCRFLGATQLQGKSIPIELYEVHWDERRTIQETVLLRGPGVVARPTRIFVLDISRDHDRLKLSAHERWPGEERPVKHYEYVEVSMPQVQQEVDAMVRLLNQAATHGGQLDARGWQDIKACGTSLYQQLLSVDIQDKLRESHATDLFLYIDDALVQLPWELLFDGQAFLCRRFSMGRIVSTPQALAEDRERSQEDTLRMLIVADPQGNLPAAAQEGQTIKDGLGDEAQRLHIDLRRSRVGTAAMQVSLFRYDVLHYAGHADYDLQDPAASGWQLADGKLTARDVRLMGETVPMPALVFCNACQSGQTDVWTIDQEIEQGIYGLANAFLLAGAQHYIGSFWKMPDQPSARFAVAFYQALAQGIGVGEALRRARQALAEQHGETSVIWASYVLYGDPTARYLEPNESDDVVFDDIETTEVVSRGEPTPQPRRKSWLALGAGAVLVLALLFIVLFTGRFQITPSARNSPLAQAYQALEQQDWPGAESRFQHLSDSTEAQLKGQAYAGLAALAFARGEYQKALDLAAQAERAEPETAYSHVIRGHIYLNQGKTDEAAVSYRTATTKSNALPWQQAVAYDRLGRIAAAQGDSVAALTHYDRAIGQKQDMAAVYANKGHLLEKLGKTEEAVDLYRKALDINPADSLTRMLLRDAERRQQLAQDRDRQQEIDRLVDELVQAYQGGGQEAAPRDEWTSRPLTLAFLDFQRRGGFAPRAGEAEFIMLSLTHALRSSRRVAIVEREVLHKVLAELKLSASDVADAQAGLGQGKILAARLLATGTFTPMGNNGVISMRLIETETTLVSATALQLVESSDDMSQVVRQIARSLLHDIRQAYPLRGRITQMTSPNHVVLDIGAAHGVTTGLVMQVFDGKAVNGDARLTPVGRIEVTQVQARSAQGRILEQSAALAPGDKAEEVVEP